MTPDITSWRRWAWQLGFIPSPYSSDQIAQGEEIIVSGAVKSIDTLKQDKFGNQRREAEEKARENRYKETTDCQWQARADEEGKPIYLCLKHNLTAPLEDSPKHE